MFYAQYPSNNTPSNAGSHHASHQGRGRRAPRVSAQNNHNKQYPRTVKKEEESFNAVNYRQMFDAGRSFDLDDDMEFCAALLTEDDLSSINSGSSSGSVRSTQSSPESSPSASQASPATFSLNSNSHPYVPQHQSFQNQTATLHQPSAKRPRNAIAIVNPSTGINLSPPTSASPARMLQQRRW